MECAVKYIREEDRGIVTSGMRPALCFRGRKVAHAVVSYETRIRVLEISLQQCDRAPVVQYHGHAYEPTRYRDRLLQIYKSGKPATQRALFFLERSEIADEDNLPPDEPADASRPEPLSVSSAGRETGSSGAQSIADRKRIENLEHARAVRSVREHVGAPLRAPKRVEKDARRLRSPGIGTEAPTKSTRKAQAKPPIGTPRTGPNCVAQLAAELKMQPQPLRVLLRAAGLRAPYVDINAMRKAIKK